MNTPTNPSAAEAEPLASPQFQLPAECCGKCTAFRPIEENPEFGHCRAHPPSFIVNDQYTFPVLHFLHGWCREFGLRQSAREPLPESAAEPGSEASP